MMLERFTDTARHLLVQAQHDARADVLCCDWIHVRCSWFPVFGMGLEDGRAISARGEWRR